MANTTHGSLAAEAAAYLADNAGAVGRFNGIQEKIKQQSDCLIEWARQKGVLLDDSYTEGLEKFEEDTTEHTVYLSPSGDGRVIKCTKPGRFGHGHGPKGNYGRHAPATPWFYLQRLQLANLEFPTDIRLEGIALGKSNLGKDEGHPYIVTSQLYIERANKQRPHPSEQEIRDLMTELGFRLLTDGAFNWFRESDGIIVTDAKPLNFITSPNGIVPIDLIISREQPAPAIT